MKRALILVLLAILATATFVGAEEPEEHALTAQIWYPLSTNKGKEDISNFNLYFLYGRLGEVRGIDAGYGFSHISGDMTGVQWSGGASLVGGDLNGVSWNGFAGGVEGRVRGVQWSGIGNWAGESVEGVQAAGIGNVATGPVRGVQAAGIVNIAGDIEGVQASGVVNVARRVQGVQVGLVNLSEEMEGLPLGLINLSRNGGVQLSGWYGGVSEANVGLRFRAGSFYTLFHYGYDTDRYDGLSASFEGASALSSGLSFGARIPVGPLYLNLDAGAVNRDVEGFYEFDEGIDQFGVQYRGMVELPLLWGFSVFGGVGSAYMVDAYEEMNQERFEAGEWEDFYFIGGGYEF